MSLDVLNKRFEDKELNNYDVMQHIRNIYNILGVLKQDEVKTGNTNNIIERLDEYMLHPFVKGTFDTMEEYQTALRNGEISEADIYLIKDNTLDKPILPVDMTWKFHGKATSASEYDLPDGYIEIDCVVRNTMNPDLNIPVHFSKVMLDNLESKRLTISTYLEESEFHSGTTDITTSYFNVTLVFNESGTKIIEVIDSFNNSDDTGKTVIDIYYR